LPSILRVAGLGPGLRVLEVGVGPGVVLSVAADMLQPGGTLHGVDIQEEMVARAQLAVRRQQLEGVLLVRADAEHLPYRDELFDVIYMVTVVGELQRQVPAIREAARVLRPTGILSVTEHFMDPHYMSIRRVERLAALAGLRRESLTGTIWHHTSCFRKPEGQAAVGAVDGVA
jgi:ubiquinone/menaquinone biosynthesis C-methylase UbiE